MVKEASTLVQIGGEDHNSTNRESDDHRDRIAGAIAHFCHHAGANKSPADEGYRVMPGRGLRHAVPKIAVAHDRPQGLTTVQFKITDKYVFNLWGH
jgi:hypothetical protein